MGLFGWLTRPRRAVFRFRAGGRWECRDPVRVRRLLDAAMPSWPEAVDAIVSAGRPLPPGADKFAGPRRERAQDLARELAAAAGAALRVPDLSDDGRAGMTEAELLALLAEFIRYCGGLKEEHRPLADAPPSTDSAAEG